MATEVIVIVDTDGTQNPHYTSLNAAIVGESGATPLVVTSHDLVVNNEQLTIECRASSGVADTPEVTVQGFTTDDLSTFKIRSCLDQKHNGIWDSEKYRLENKLTILNSYFILEDLQIHTNLKDVVYLGDAGTTDVSHIKINRCFLVGSRTTSSYVFHAHTADFLDIENTIIFHTGNPHRVLNIRYVHDVKLRNVTAYSLNQPSSVFLRFDYCNRPFCYNTIMGVFSRFGGDLPDGDHNISLDDDSAPGVNSLHNQSAIDLFVDPINGDFRLKETSPTRDAGTDLSASMDAVDIAGTTRPQGDAWDIGAFEYVVEDEGGTPYLITHDGHGRVSTHQITTQDAQARASSTLLSNSDTRAAIVSPVTVTHDSRVRVSGHLLRLADGSSAISTSLWGIHDGQAAISETTGYYASMDAIAKISTLFGGIHDSRTALSAAFYGIHDAQVAISEITGYFVSMDAVAKISALFGGIHDSRTALSTSFYGIHDGQGSVATPYAAMYDGRMRVSDQWLILQDAQAAVSASGFYYATMDTLAGISTLQQIKLDGAGRISLPVAIIQDARAAVSEAKVFIEQADGLAKISGAIAVRQDTIIGVATSYAMLMDMAAGVSNTYAIIHDGMAYVLQVDFRQKASMQFASAGSMSVRITSKARIKQAFQSKATTFVRVT